jgi:tetratricopeptide (TPR) repeat protein
MWNQLHRIAIESPSPPPHLYYLAARTRDRLGLYGEAERMLSEYLRRWPQGADAPDATINLARSVAAMGRVDQAMELFDAYERNWPGHVRISNLPWYRGSLLAENGQWGRALPYFRETLARYPGNTTADDAHFYLCLGLHLTGDPRGRRRVRPFHSPLDRKRLLPPGQVLPRGDPCGSRQPPGAGDP